MNEPSTQRKPDSSRNVTLKVTIIVLSLVLCYGIYAVTDHHRVSFDVNPYKQMTNSATNIEKSGAMIKKEGLVECHSRASVKTSLAEAIDCYSLDGVIVIASFDVTYAQMALNLYLTSFKKFNITNHLFVSSDVFGCSELEPHGAHCVQYKNMTKAKGPSIYNSLEYNIKANIKPRLVLDCLEIGVAVLLVDLDIVFLKNPFPRVTRCKDCDFITHMDHSTINSGFYLLKPTKAGIQLFNKVVKRISKKPTGDQVYVNAAFHEMKRTNSIKEEFLPEKLFPVGRLFFTEQHRMFIGDNPCTECVIVHNNYVISVEAKRYRFMEYGLWDVDTNGYYSSKDRKYIEYTNPIESAVKTGHGTLDTLALELRSLRFGLMLGHILNRTLIMPKFHCAGVSGYNPLPPTQMCHFEVHFCVRKFESQFPMIHAYRENVFLKHRLVPEATKTSKSEPYVIDSDIWRQSSKKTSLDQTSEVKVFKPSGASGVSAAEIRQWFSAESHHVLVFHSLYNTMMEQDSDVKAFNTKLNAAIKRSNFMQSKGCK